MGLFEMCLCIWCFKSRSGWSCTHSDFTRTQDCVDLCPYKNHMRGYALKVHRTWFSWNNKSETMVQSEKLCYSLSFIHGAFQTDACSIGLFLGVKRAPLDSWSIHMFTDHVVVLQTRAKSCWCSIANDYFGGCCCGCVGLARMRSGRKTKREYAAR